MRKNALFATVATPLLLALPALTALLVMGATASPLGAPVAATLPPTPPLTGTFVVYLAVLGALTWVSLFGLAVACRARQ